MEKKRREIFKFFFSFLFFYFIKFNINLLASSSRTKILTNPIFFKHHISKEHPESPERIKYILNYLQKTDYVKLIEIIETNRNVENWIKKIHTNQHIISLKKNHSIAEEVSKYAVRICLEAVDMILRKESKNIFCAVRPPGHHALNTGKEEGFCYYNHIAITAKYIQQKYNLKKILIIDWDYHHGNSTESFFYNDPSVLFFSTHDRYAYPGTGLPSKEGKGKGYGFNINVHLPCGTEDDKILSVFNKILIPKANLFKPDFILISSGFDSRINDLLGCYKITDIGFKKLTKIVTNLAAKHCDNRIISILEGGYNLDGNAKASIAHVSELNNLN
jgi:acetoin utilization deacetylase AcuC-like enzyme